ncbi:MAG: alpha amylase N-terminal ig-like domain-containing protein [Armatimonadetes bacterium]|nr:alpha amylase N-terminal ig-like domain-containing protein [Armatimonadota bacterium]
MNGIMICALLGVFAGSDQVAHRFEFTTTEDLKAVSVAGEFNNWNKDANPMTKAAGTKNWSATVNLSPGSYQYKFVLNGERWVTDPKAFRNVDDGNGNTNSLLLIVPEDYTKYPAKIGDGLITPSAVTHIQEVPNLNFDQGKLTVTLTARTGDVQSLQVDLGGKLIPMRKIGSNDLRETYRATLPWDRKSNLNYFFVLTDGSKTSYFGPKGLSSTNKTPFSLDAMKFKPFEVPSWVEGTVFYQIFPDRFDNGSKENDPKNLTKWVDKPTYDNRYGGDVAGVNRRTEYLKAIGVNGVYFNPVMFAPSNHRYDPSDFYRVDPEFGTNAEFIKMTHELDRQGIRVVLDQIFDHVGVTFPPFADVLRFQEKSRFKDWFFITGYPVEVKPNPNYVGWWGTEWMPKINLANKDAYNYLMESVDFWMAQAKLSGWRLDVANEPPQWFWQDFRKRVKGHNPNAWIVGEVWYDANPWLKGDQWDASMNYPFRDVVIQYVAKGSTKPTQFVNNLMRVYGLYAPQVSRNQLNLISSHDTPRFLHEAGNDRKLQALGAVVQFTWPGAPSVYYGEEIGMEGAQDPDNRRAMRWDMVGPKNELLSLYSKLIAVRKGASVLHNGEPVIFNQFDNENVATYGRVSGQDLAVVVINRSSKQFKGAVQLGAANKNRVLVDVLTGKTFTADSQGRLTVTLEPVSALVGLNNSNTHLSLVRDAEKAASRALSRKESMP